MSALLFYKLILTTVWRISGAGHPWENSGSQARCRNPGERGQNHSSEGEAGESPFQSTVEQIFTECPSHGRKCVRRRGG